MKGRVSVKGVKVVCIDSYTQTTYLSSITIHSHSTTPKNTSSQTADAIAMATIVHTTASMVNQVPWICVTTEPFLAMVEATLSRTRLLSERRPGNSLQGHSQPFIVPLGNSRHNGASEVVSSWQYTTIDDANVMPTYESPVSINPSMFHKVLHHGLCYRDKKNFIVCHGSWRCMRPGLLQW